MMSIFLGGTVGTNSWRQDIVIPGLIERGVLLNQISSPQRPGPGSYSNAEATALVERCKANATLHLHVVALPYPQRAAVTQVSVTALIEAVCGLYDDPERAVLMFDVIGLSTITRRELAISVADLHRRFPDAPIFDNYAKMLDYLALRLVVEQKEE